MDVRGHDMTVPVTFICDGLADAVEAMQLVVHRQCERSIIGPKAHPTFTRRWKKRLPLPCSLRTFDLVPFCIFWHKTHRLHPQRPGFWEIISDPTCCHQCERCSQKACDFSARKKNVTAANAQEVNVQSITSDRERNGYILYITFLKLSPVPATFHCVTIGYVRRPSATISSAMFHSPQTEFRFSCVGAEPEIATRGVSCFRLCFPDCFPVHSCLLVLQSSRRFSRTEGMGVLSMRRQGAVPSSSRNACSSEDAIADADALTSSWTTISSYPIAVICFFAVALTAYVFFALDANIQTSYGVDGKHDALRYPSAYVGFDRLTRNATSPSWPLTFARAVDYVTVVDANAPSDVASPDESIVFTSNTSLILQYRVRDHGLENCAVSVRTSRNASMTEGMEGLGVMAWLLEASASRSSRRTIDFSWSTKPERQAFLGRFNISSTHVVSRSSSFPCQARSRVLVELSLDCASSGLCSVDLGRNQAFARHAVSIIQSEAPLLN